MGPPCGRRVDPSRSRGASVAEVGPEPNGSDRNDAGRSDTPLDDDTAADPTVAQRDRAEGQPGPGLRRTGRTDPTLVTAWVFAVLGYTPISWVERAFGIAYFGPLAWPAIVAMVGVLFGVIALLRSLDLDDRRLRAWAAGALALGLVRVLLFPFF